MRFGNSALQRYSLSHLPRRFTPSTGTVPVKWKNVHTLWMGDRWPECSSGTILATGGLVSSAVTYHIKCMVVYCIKILSIIFFSLICVYFHSYILFCFAFDVVWPPVIPSQYPPAWHHSVQAIKNHTATNVTVQASSDRCTPRATTPSPGATAAAAAAAAATTTTTTTVTAAATTKGTTWEWKIDTDQIGT